MSNASDKMITLKWPQIITIESLQLDLTSECDKAPPIFFHTDPYGPRADYEAIIDSKLVGWVIAQIGIGR